MNARYQQFHRHHQRYTYAAILRHKVVAVVAAAHCCKTDSSLGNSSVLPRDFPNPSIHTRSHGNHRMMTAERLVGGVRYGRLKYTGIDHCRKIQHIYLSAAYTVLLYYYYTFIATISTKQEIETFHIKPFWGSLIKIHKSSIY